MHRNTESECFNPHLVNQAYPISDLLPRIFGSGDSLLRCAVSPNRPSSSFLWKSDQFSSLARNHGRRVWKNRYILDISIQAEKSHTQCIVWCCACRWCLKGRVMGMSFFLSVFIQCSLLDYSTFMYSNDTNWGYFRCRTDCLLGPKSIQTIAFAWVAYVQEYFTHGFTARTRHYNNCER